MKALIFDLDGTLIDSVYPHTLAWQQALNEVEMVVPACEIHRRIGLSGKLLVKALGRRRSRSFDQTEIDALEKRHDALFREMAALQLPLPGAIELLRFLRQSQVAHGIATTGKRSEIETALAALEIDDSTLVVDGSMAGNAKPEPDLFVECRSRLGVEASEALIIGDAVWDVHAARRARMLAVGLLSGGSGEQELSSAGAMRIYRDPADMLASIDELGLKLP
ncbi:MAG TPA: HAD family hydrolase [Steroidobacteraceae bacterium]|jgi:HAD superfamily hydrolase (TIGR01549 family)|nr:HAD family hydrolase [Steroidobacteraceae bacterium]